jgi:hypothetical protein
MIIKTLYTGTEIKSFFSGFITASKAVMSGIAIGPGGSIHISVIRGCHGQIIIKTLLIT